MPASSPVPPQQTYDSKGRLSEGICSATNENGRDIALAGRVMASPGAVVTHGAGAFSSSYRESRQVGGTMLVLIGAQLAYRRTRQPGTLRQSARLTEERAAGSRPLFSIRRRRVDSLARQAHDHVDASDFVALRRYGNFADGNISRGDIHQLVPIFQIIVMVCLVVGIKI